MHGTMSLSHACMSTACCLITQIPFRKMHVAHVPVFSQRCALQQQGPKIIQGLGPMPKKRTYSPHPAGSRLHSVGHRRRRRLLLLVLLGLPGSRSRRRPRPRPAVMTLISGISAPRSQSAGPAVAADRPRNAVLLAGGSGVAGVCGDLGCCRWSWVTGISGLHPAKPAKKKACPWWSTYELSKCDGGEQTSCKVEVGRP